MKKLRDVVKQKYSRTVIRLKRLQLNLNKIKNEMKDISSTHLQTILKDCNIPECQTELIQEIFNASRVKNPKNRRYSENCMLLNFVISNGFNALVSFSSISCIYLYIFSIRKFI